MPFKAKASGFTMDLEVSPKCSGTKKQKNWILMAFHESGKPYLNLSKPWIASGVIKCGWKIPTLVSYYLKKSLVKVSSITINKKNHPQWPYQKPIRNADRFWKTPGWPSPLESSSAIANIDRPLPAEPSPKAQGSLIDQQNHPTWWNIGKNALKIGISWNWWWLNQTVIELSWWN